MAILSTSPGILTKTIVWKPLVTDLTQTIFTADEAYVVTAVTEVHGVVSTSGTFQLEKLTGTTVPGSGTSILTGTINLAGTINTSVSGTVTGTVATKTLAIGDRLGGVLGGVLTGLLGCTVTITLARG